MATDLNKLEESVTKMVTGLIADKGVAYAQELLKKAFEKAGDLPIVQKILGFLNGATEEDRDSLLINIPGACSPLPQDVGECHTSEGWRDRDCDGVADKDDKCPDSGDQGCGVDENGCPIPCE